jgi:PKD repeat protein
MSKVAWSSGGARDIPDHGARRVRAAMLAVGLCGLMLGPAAGIAGSSDTPRTVGGPQALEEELIVFAAIGDFGAGSSAAGNVAMLVNGWSPQFIVGAGDTRYGATTFDQVVGQFYCGYLANAGVGNYCNGGTSPTNAFFPVLGNHDYSDGGGLNEYLNYFTLPGASIASSNTSGNERYYDFVIGPVHFFAVDSQGALSSTSDRNAQRAWLQAQLAASTTAWQVVLFHHAPYSSGQHGGTAAMQWPFASWGADAVIAGHDHTYERLEIGGIPYFVNGLGGKSLYVFGTPVPGSQFRYNSNYGAMRISADAEQMTFDFINIAGVVVDSFTTNGEVIPPPPAATLANRIVSGVDDVEEKLGNGVMSFNSSDIELGEDPSLNGAQTVGLRFQYLYIPQGASIDAAHLEFTVDETHSVATNVVIRAEAADNAPEFSTTNFNLTGRALTAASTPWNIPAWSTAGAKQQSPDISAVLQEVIDRDGWSANNSIVFVISGAGQRTAEAYDGVPGSATLLHVEYSTPAPANDAPTASFASSASGLTANFTDTSTDSDGSLVGWLWDFGDDTGSTLRNPSHTYGAAGTYTATLVVTDDDGATDNSSQSVTVTNPTGC